MVGVVRRRQERSSAQSSGGKFAFVTLSDPTGEYEVLFPPEALRTYRDLLEPGNAIVLKVRAKSNDGKSGFSATTRGRLSRAIEHVVASLRIHLSPAVASLDVLKARLKLADTGGGGVVCRRLRGWA